MSRIASLLPSTTEIVCALGQTHALVGLSHECDFPEAVGHLPRLTTTKLKSGRSGLGIDQEVRHLIEEGLSIYHVDADRLRSVAPEIILTQDQCAVCAASQADVERALARWLGPRPTVVSLSPNTLEDVWNDIRTVAAAIGCAERGVALSATLTDRLTQISKRAQAQPNRPRVACIEWVEPLMSAGNWMPELITLAGAEPTLGEAGKHSPFISWEQLHACDPDVVIIIPCGFDLSRTRVEAEALLKRSEFRALRAVKHASVFFADGNAYFNRPGPRLVDSLEILCEILHSGAFARKHLGWSQLASEPLP